jgi:pyruvate-formate lyase-activating enzyme
MKTAIFKKYIKYRIICPYCGEIYIKEINSDDKDESESTKEIISTIRRNNGAEMLCKCGNEFNMQLEKEDNEST